MTDSSTSGKDLRAWVTDGIDADSLATLSTQMPATELWSLLLTVADQRARQRSFSMLQQQWATDRFVAMSYVDQRTLLQLDMQLFAAAADFEAIELSPLAPLGSCSSMALTTQNRVVATMRGTEVVSDPTNVLALESARRLRTAPGTIVRLATSHRCVRAQALPRLPGFAAHFRMFCMTTAGREIRDHGLVVTALHDHITTHLAAMDRLEHCGYRFPDRIVTLLATHDRQVLAERVAEQLPGVTIAHQPLTKDYYHGLRFMISADSANGDKIPLIDGGVFDWVARLASNRKLVFVASATGSQLAAYLFRPDKPDPTRAMC